MNIPGAVLENYREPRALDLSGLEDYLKRVDSSIANMASMTAQGVARGMENKNQEKADNNNYISGLKNKESGIIDLDLHNDAELLKVQQNMMHMSKPKNKGGLGMSPQDIQLYGIRELPKIDNAYKIGKSYKDQTDKQAVDLEKTYGSGFDLSAFNAERNKRIANDILERDENGKIKGYKDFESIPKNRNYAGEIESDPESLGTVFKSSGSFQKGLEQTTKIPLKGSGTYTDKYGKKVKRKILGDGTIYDDPVINDDNEQTGWRLKGEAVPLGRNEDCSLNIAEVMPTDQFNVMVDTPSKRKDFDIYVKGKLDETGVNVGKLDGRAKDVLERKFAIDYLRKTNAHGSSFYTEDEVKKAPVKNITNNNTRVGGAKEVPVMDIVTPVQNYFGSVGEQKEGLKGVAQLNLFNNEVTTPVINEVKNRYPDITAEDIYYQKDGNDIWVMKANESGKVDKQKDVPVFKLDGFSNVTGNKTQGQKSKNKALTQAQSGGTDNKPTAGYTNVQTLQDSKGKSIQAGVKGGKWYDIKTGKPIE